MQILEQLNVKTHFFSHPAAQLLEAGVAEAVPVNTSNIRAGKVQQTAATLDSALTQ
jgi:hypothetical protein